MSKIQSVLVYGATGDQARPVVRRLLESGRTVRALTRNPAKAADLKAWGADVVLGDFEDPASLEAASRGMDGVFLLVPFFDPRLAHAEHAIAAARAANIRLIVWNPTGSIPPAATGNPALDVRMEIRDALRSSGLPVVTVTPTAYLENFLGPWTQPELARSDTFAYPLPPTARVQFVSQEDVAAYSVAAFDRPELAGQEIEIAGPERLAGDEIADRLSRGLGRAVTFRSMPPAEFGAHLDRLFGPGAGAGATAFYEAAFENPQLISTQVDHGLALARLPIAPLTLEAWSRERAAILDAGR